MYDFAVEDCLTILHVKNNVSIGILENKENQKSEHGSHQKLCLQKIAF